MSGSETMAPPSRLLFLPETFDFAAQPTIFQLAYGAIIEPAYQQLIVAYCDSLEKSISVPKVRTSTLRVSGWINCNNNGDNNDSGRTFGEMIINK